MTDLQALYAEYQRIKAIYDEVAKQYSAAKEAYERAMQAETLAKYGLAIGDRILVTPEISRVFLIHNNPDDRFAPGAECVIHGAYGNRESIYTHFTIQHEGGAGVGGFTLGMIIDARHAYLAQQKQAAG